MIDRLTRRDFEGLSDGSVSFEYEGLRVPLAVHELRDLPVNAHRAEPFAVVLAGPAQPMVPQGTHALNHPVHGRLELFVVPLGRQSASLHYEIIFN
jgi:hypothetical protein